MDNKKRRREEISDLQLNIIYSLVSDQRGAEDKSASTKFYISSSGSSAKAIQVVVRGGYEINEMN